MRTPLLMLAASLVAIGAAHHPAVAQQSSAPAATPASAGSPGLTRQPEVVVTADRAALQVRLTRFVNQVTDFDYGDMARELARWQDPACPLVTGLPRGMGEYILERTSEIAHEIGAPLGGEKCRPNMFIIVTKNPEKDLKYLENRHVDEVFGQAAPYLINQFITTPHPVRTWYDTIERTSDGLPMMSMSFPGISQQKVEDRGGGIVIFPVRPSISGGSLTNPWSQASHLELNVIWAIKRVFVIIDPTKFKGVALGQLADYVAMTGLAQIRLDENLNAAPTILTLFDKDPKSVEAGLTDWDRSFLKALYATEAKSVKQRSQIAEAMLRDLAP
jgi:hypothetical protein